MGIERRCKMSRQTNLRTMEERIYQLEKNGGGAGGSVKWSDVTYKPFKTLDSNDFVVESDKLKLKNGGGSTTEPCIFITNTEEMLAYTNIGKTVNIVSAYPVNDTMTAFAGWKVTMTNEPEEGDIVAMTSEELTSVCAGLDFIEEVDTASTLTGTYVDSEYNCRWENGDLIGYVFIHRPMYLVDNYRCSYKMKTNDSGVLAITF